MLLVEFKLQQLLASSSDDYQKIEFQLLLLIFLLFLCITYDSVLILQLNCCVHYANMPMQYTAIFHACKNVNFQMIFFLFFLLLLKTLIVGTR